MSMPSYGELVYDKEVAKQNNKYESHLYIVNEREKKDNTNLRITSNP